MSLLEDRYRYVLRLLPASYRAEREEEMVGAFLEGSGGLSDADNPRPRWSEIASVAALSMRVRLGSTGAAPRFFAWGEAVRLVAVLGLFFQAVMSCVWLADLLRLYWGFGPSPADYQAALGAAGSAHRLWDIVRMCTYLLWGAASVSLVRGRPRAAKTLALLALALLYGPIIIQSWAWGWSLGLSDSLLHSLPTVVPVLALMAGFHRDVPRLRHPWWVAALPVGVGVALYAILSVLNWVALAPVVNWQFWSWVWPWLGESGLACLAILVASVVCAGTHLRTPSRRTPSLPLALAILVVPVTLDLVPGPFDAADPIAQTMAAVTTGQFVALLLCGLVLIVLATRTMSALPQVNPRVEQPPDSP
ncbi:hypothetical protein [Streptosporangium sp. NPDC087985]|uniref:hypothetical protein n=1 Tax=Streptosporangium sp. NPDC087985 TaxID=3366196 RepID=UPI0038093373